MKFSLPLNPKISENDFKYFVEFCKKYKDHIHDVYFTCRIPPFLQDAMGDIFIQTEDNLFAIDVALYLQEETGIPVSATFNNITVRPDQKNLDLWINNFKLLYDAGVRSCTLPHTTWMLTGQIQKAFPDLFIKNTILHNVSEAREVANLAKAGFHYVNLDRVLMRDHERLKEIKQVKEKYPVKLSLLANESCLGGCPIMNEHYQFNNTRSNSPQYFTDPISRISCSHWKTQDGSYALKAANFTPFREDWLEFEELGIDVVKMHGRENTDVFKESLQIVENFINSKEILFEEFDDYLNDTNLENRPIEAWRKKIKTCKFNCWDCNFCDDVWHAKGNTNDKRINKLSQIIIDSVNSDYDNSIEGLSSSRIKKLLNEIGKISKNYLEIGVLNGSTFCAAIENNQLNAYAVDMWKDNTQASNGSTNITPSKEKFSDNARSVKGLNSIKVFDADFRTIDKDTLPEIDFFFYDADHSEKSTMDAVTYFADKFSNDAILIFDDANWSGVVSGVDKGLKKAGLNVVFSRILLNEQESEKDWWNGLYILIVRKG